MRVASPRPGVPCGLLLLLCLCCHHTRADDQWYVVSAPVPPPPACRRNLTEINGFTANLFEGYDNTIMPDVDGRGTGGPVHVRVELTVQDIPNLAQNNASFTLDGWYSQYWRDPRLAYDHLDPAGCRTNISLAWHTVIGQLWTPNVCVVNSYATTVHASPQMNVLGMIFPNGTVWINYRIRVEAPCEIDLRRFPMDTQKCQLVFESYSYNTDEITLNWLEDAPLTFIKQLHNFRIPEFEVIRAGVRRRSEKYTAGRWHQLIVDLAFRRRLGYYTLQAFIPTGLCLLIGWLGFFLPSECIRARVSLGVMALTLLTFNIGNVMMFGLPRASGVRALDVWIVGCLTISFLTLIELCVASVLDALVHTETLQWRVNKGDMRLLYEHNPYLRHRLSFSKLYTTPKLWGEAMDFWSMRLFPAGTLALAGLYYYYYMIVMEQSDTPNNSDSKEHGVVVL